MSTNVATALTGDAVESKTYAYYLDWDGQAVEWGHGRHLMRIVEGDVYNRLSKHDPELSTEQVRIIELHPDDGTATYQYEIGQHRSIHTRKVERLGQIRSVGDNQCSHLGVTEIPDGVEPHVGANVIESRPIPDDVLEEH